MGKTTYYTYEVRTTVRCAKLPDYEVVSIGQVCTSRADLVQLHLQELMRELKVSTDVHSLETTVIEKKHIPHSHRGNIR